MKTLELKFNEVSEWLGTGTLNFFGMPFAGKDTQAEKFAERLDVSILGGGDILRNSVIPSDVQASMERGELIPSDDYKKIVMPYLAQAAFAGKPLLLSSVGRVVGEEVGVLAATEAAGHPTMAVPYLHITEAEAFHRLKNMPDRGRADDNPESLKRRLSEFEEKTLPVLTAYEEQGLLVPVGAMGDRDVVFTDVVNSLHERAMAA